MYYNYDHNYHDYHRYYYDRPRWDYYHRWYWDRPRWDDYLLHTDPEWYSRYRYY